MWTAVLASLNLLDGADYDVWSVNSEARVPGGGRGRRGRALRGAGRRGRRVGEAERHRRRRGDEVQRVQRHAGDGAHGPEPRGEQAVERGIQRDEPGRSARGERGPAGHRARRFRPARRRRSVARASRGSGVSALRGARRSSSTHGAPRRSRSVLDHRTDRPALQVRAADRRVEPIRRPPRASRSPSSTSSIDGCGYRAASKPPTPAKTSRRTAPSPAQNVSAAPAARACTWWWSRLRKPRDEPGRLRPVVVGAEDGRDRRVGERGADPRERVGGDEHVGVDEDEDVAAALARRRRSAPPPAPPREAR